MDFLGTESDADVVVNSFSSYFASEIFYLQELAFLFNSKHLSY
jgi:hypothetical protein